jgi:hypothetical protein
MVRRQGDENNPPQHPFAHEHSGIASSLNRQHRHTESAGGLAEHPQGSYNLARPVITSRTRTLGPPLGPSPSCTPNIRPPPSEVTHSQTHTPSNFSENHYNATNNSGNELRQQEKSKSVYNPYLMNGQTPTQLFQFGNNNIPSVGVPDAPSDGRDSAIRRNLSSQRV